MIGIITKASVSSLESSCFSKYSGAPQRHPVLFHAKGPPLPPPPYISLLYIIYHISLLHPRWDEQCRDTMMTVPPQLTSSLPSFSYPASFRHPPPASSCPYVSTTSLLVTKTPRNTKPLTLLPSLQPGSRSRSARCHHGERTEEGGYGGGVDAVSWGYQLHPVTLGQCFCEQRVFDQFENLSQFVPFLEVQSNTNGNFEQKEQVDLSNCNEESSFEHWRQQSP